MASTAVLTNGPAANTTQPDVGSPQHPATSSAGGNTTAAMITAVALTGVVGLALIVLCICAFCVRRRRTGGTDVEQQNRTAASAGEEAPDPEKAPVIIVQPDCELVLAFKDQQLSEGDDGDCKKEKGNVRDDLERRDSAFVEAAEESGTCNPAGCI